MKRIRSSGGFTLVELIVSVAIGAIVMGAAASVMLLGLRMNQQGNRTTQNQFTTRIVMTMLEDLASEGEIGGIVTDESGWTITGEAVGENEVPTILSYNSAKQSISAADTEILKNVYASHISVTDKGLITFSIETPEGNFNSSVYCRTLKSNYTGSDAISTILGGINTDNTGAANIKFLQALASQYPTDGTVNKGQIIGGDGAGQFYSQWYLGGTYSNGWDKDTPWCACFISWGLQTSGMSNPPKFAYVDESENSYLTYCQKNSKWKDGEDYTPQPGDLIFFDWIVDGEANPQHIGAVLAVKEGYVYTIEGNSAGIVAVRKYALDDKRILGYGVLNWNN